ncbi:MAG: hypothetical protein HC871_13610 [Rhizobiales bacterium]|nr:hypothetical protein [Hyphomicrobiales bacterium]
MSNLRLALELGHRIRHRDWPPFHFAELRRTAQDRLSLCRIAPTGQVTPLDLPWALVSEENGWCLAEVEPNAG